MRNYVKSDPFFFRRIKIALAVGAGLLLLLAALIPAPLQGPADISRVPNPSKAAWFLLWTQEVVSYGNSFVYLIVGIGVLFALLPWLPGSPENHRASWFPAEQKWVSALAVATCLGIVALTLVAMYFRGENWSFVSPF